MPTFLVVLSNLVRVTIFETASARRSVSTQKRHRIQMPHFFFVFSGTTGNAGGPVFLGLATQVTITILKATNVY